MSGEDHVTVKKEVGRKARPLDDYKQEEPAKAIVKDRPKEKMDRMTEETRNTPQTAMPSGDYADEGALTLATPGESKLLVEDMSKRYGTPPGFVLVFKSRTTGALSTYLTKNFYSALIEKKGYSRTPSIVPGPRHQPEAGRFQYIASLIPLIPNRAMDELRLLKDVDREEFLKVWREWTKPVEEEGYADASTVRMRTMRTPYNMDRLARTRAYRHLAALYCGLSSGGDAEAAGEVRDAQVVVETNAVNVAQEGE